MPFIYPTAAEMREIEQDLLPRAEADRLGLRIMPIVRSNFGKVRWTQKDNYYGLQQLRGMDGEPTHVLRVGQKTYEYEPGVFGEFVDITETELTTRANNVNVLTTNISIADLVIEATDLLISRELDRIESSIWALITSGTLTIKMDGPNGIQTGFTDTYPIQTYTAGVTWATAATATPIVNFQSVQQLQLGSSVDLGAGAMAIMNTVTANRLLNNQNSADFAGRRLNFGQTVNSIMGVNQFLAAQNLPQITVYDGGYIPNAPPGNVKANFTKFIPDGKVVVVGRRTSGAQVGQYLVTRNASAGFQPQSYQYTLDRANGGGQGRGNAEKRTPANVEIHRGHNGGPAIFFPSAIVLMNV